MFHLNLRQFKVRTQLVKIDALGSKLRLKSLNCRMTLSKWLCLSCPYQQNGDYSSNHLRGSLLGLNGIVSKMLGNEQRINRSTMTGKDARTRKYKLSYNLCLQTFGYSKLTISRADDDIRETAILKPC